MRWAIKWGTRLLLLFLVLFFGSAIISGIIEAIPVILAAHQGRGVVAANPVAAPGQDVALLVFCSAATVQIVASDSPASMAKTAVDVFASKAGISHEEALARLRALKHEYGDWNGVARGCAREFPAYRELSAGQVAELSHKARLTGAEIDHQIVR